MDGTVGRLSASSFTLLGANSVIYHGAVSDLMSCDVKSCPETLCTIIVSPANEALLDKNGATSTLPARTFLVTGEKKYLIKIVPLDGEWCREFTACQTFSDVRRH
jgi:hypothetical protein